MLIIQFCTLQTYRKSTYSGLLLNFKSFTSFSYKISLIKCLIDRSFRICNNWNSFHKIKSNLIDRSFRICTNWNSFHKIKSNLIKNEYPPFLVYKVIKKYLDYKFYSNQNQLKYKSDVHYFKLPYICNLSHHIKIKLSKLSKEFCKENFNIKLFFNSFKIKNYFVHRDPIPNDLESFLVYKFTCASCSSSYIGETCRHFKTRIEEHIKKDNKSHIFKHLHSTAICFDSYKSLCFKIIDKANSKFDLKTKKALHINWRKHNLNEQQNDLALTLSPQLLIPLLLSVCFCFCFFIFCISLSSVVFIICTLIINFFYCLNYTLILLHHFITHLVIDFITM